MIVEGLTKQHYPFYNVARESCDQELQDKERQDIHQGSQWESSWDRNEGWSAKPEATGYHLPAHNSRAGKEEGTRQAKESSATDTRKGRDSAGIYHEDSEDTIGETDGAAEDPFVHFSRCTSSVNLLLCFAVSEELDYTLCASTEYKSIPRRTPSESQLWDVSVKGGVCVCGVPGVVTFLSTTVPGKAVWAVNSGIYLVLCTVCVVYVCIVNERSAPVCSVWLADGMTVPNSFLNCCQKACQVCPCKCILLHVYSIGFVVKQALWVEMRTTAGVIQQCFLSM